MDKDNSEVGNRNSEPRVLLRAATLTAILLAACFTVVLFAANQPSSDEKLPAWSPKAAAAYLDGRETWWMSWPTAARDHQTFCLSCHTVVPYAMARPTLRSALAEDAPSPVERRLLDNVTKRVRIWQEVEPFYPDAKRGVPKTTESRGTESILNALVLARYDAPSGKLSSVTRLAFDNMWAEQLKTGEARGAWSWLQFHNSPWEGDSQYYGAALAALAVGTAPENYKSTPPIQENLNLLRDYLVRERDSQILINRVILLWGSTKLGGLLSIPQESPVVDEALSKQQADGGFSLSAFVGNWKRKDGTPLETKSDGYATGVVVFVLLQSGVRSDEPHMKRALDWLRSNQDKAEGRWFAYSLNKQHDLFTETGRFMSDAATAYAVLALTQAK